MSFPIQAIHIPHDEGLVYTVLDGVIDGSIRRTRDLSLNACRFLNSFLGIQDLFFCIIQAQFWQLRVIPGMVPDLMTFFADLLSNIRIRTDIFSDHKEGSFSIVFLQDSQCLRGRRWIWSIIKGQGNHLTMAFFNIGLVRS